MLLVLVIFLNRAKTLWTPSILFLSNWYTELVLESLIYIICSNI